MIPIFALFIPIIIFSICMFIFLTILGILAFFTIKKLWNEVKGFLGKF